jgi:PAS domain S-box-containing protein
MGARSERLLGFEDTFAWSLLESVPDGIVMAAESGDIGFVNDLAATMLGHAAGDLIDRPAEDLLPEALRPVHRADRTRYRVEPADSCARWRC